MLPAISVTGYGSFGSRKWECLATFICSSMKQVAHIRQISLALRKRFGEQRRIDDQLVYTFASPRRVAQASEKELRDCKLGYRAKNLRATARLVSSGQADLEAWSALSDAELRKQLCALPGVGPKIANCVMLFAYERLRAFPIDVWIERVLRQHYFSGRRENDARSGCGSSLKRTSENTVDTRSSICFITRGVADAAIGRLRSIAPTSDGMSEGRGGSPGPPNTLAKLSGLVA